MQASRASFKAVGGMCSGGHCRQIAYARRKRTLKLCFLQSSTNDEALKMSFPYTFISCPCTDVSTPINGSTEQNDDEEQERTFDPRSPRANFSLYTLEHLLYCEDCQQIRCPRCTLEEIVTWYCPNCLFEMPSSMVKSEAGR